MATAVLPTQAYANEPIIVDNSTRNKFIIIGLIATIAVAAAIYAIYTISELTTTVSTLTTSLTNTKASVTALQTKTAYVTYDATGNATFAKNVNIAGSLAVASWYSLLVTKVKNLATEQGGVYSAISSGFVYGNNFIVWNFADVTTAVTGTALYSDYMNTADPAQIVIPAAGIWTVRVILAFDNIVNSSTQIECYMGKNQTINTLTNYSGWSSANILGLNLLSNGIYETTLIATQYFAKGDYISSAFYCNNALQTTGDVGVRSSLYLVRES